MSRQEEVSNKRGAISRRFIACTRAQVIESCSQPTKQARYWKVDPRSLPDWRRELPSFHQTDQLAGEITLSDRRNTFANSSSSKPLRRHHTAQTFQLFPIIQSAVEINGKDWRQKARNLSIYFHFPADLVLRLRGDA